MRHKDFRKAGFTALKRAVAATLICTSLTALLTSCSEPEEKKELLAPVVSAGEIGVCERGDIAKLMVRDAHVEGDYEVLSFDEDGYIFEVFSKVGDEVGKGDAVAALTSADFIEIMTLEEEIEEIKKENEKRRNYLEAQVKLKEKNGENAEEERLTCEKEEALMDLKLSQKEARYKKLKDEDIGYNYITAPGDGHVVAITSSGEGAYITAGTPVAAVATEDTGLFISGVYIPEKEAVLYNSFYAIINGKEYPLSYEPIPKEKLAMLSAAQLSLKSRFDFVEAPGEEVSIGDYAAVIIVADKKENVLTVPVNSVYTDKDGRFVYVITEGDKKERREVVTGLSDGARIEVIEGVTEGECVYVEN